MDVIVCALVNHFDAFVLFLDKVECSKISPNGFMRHFIEKLFKYGKADSPVYLPVHSINIITAYIASVVNEFLVNRTDLILCPQFHAVVDRQPDLRF